MPALQKSMFLPSLCCFFLHTEALVQNSLQTDPIERVEPLDTFGEARYASGFGNATWVDIVGSGSKLGAVCDPSTPEEACGSELVCTQGVCRQCRADSDCPSLHQCVRGLVNSNNKCLPETRMVWERVVTDPWEFLCTILLFCASAMAAAAGTGGGGMFVPLLMALSGLDTQAAVPLSQCMILFGSIVNLVFFGSQRHPKHPEQAVIDYDCVVLLEPMLCLGVTIGILLNRISPQWLLLLLLGATLGLGLWRTWTKAWKQYKQEKEAGLATPEADAPEPRSTPFEEFRAYLSEVSFLTNANTMQILGILIVWLVMLAASFHPFATCSRNFALLIGILGGALLAVTAMAVRYIVGTQVVGEDDQTLQAVRAEAAVEKAEVCDCPEFNMKVIGVKKPVDWAAGGSGLGAIKFPLIAFAAGGMGGLLGIGGGIIMSPVLLEVGMHSEATQATTAMFVFLSSSLATIQFASLGRHVWHYALWYSSVTVLATVLGQKLCAVYVKKHKRYSLITFAIAGVLAFSLLALTIVGAINLTADIRQGQPMWFTTTRLCGGDDSIMSSDVTESVAWPADLPVL